VGRGVRRGLRGISLKGGGVRAVAGAQHGFDLFHSLRFEQVVDGIEVFLTWVRSTTGPPPGMAGGSAAALA